MKKLALLLAGLLLCAGAPAIPPGAPGANRTLSNTSPSIARSNIAPVTARAPLPTDVAGYTAGVSQWIDGNNQPWQLTSIAAGQALWNRVQSPGVFPASAVPGGTFSGGTACYVSNWTNAILVLTRPSDGTTQAIGCVNGKLDLATAIKFAQPSGGIVYVTAVHDQTDNGAYDNALNTAYDWTQSTIANAPRLGLEYAVNGNVPMVMDSTFRDYWVNVTVWPITNTSGSTAFCFNSDGGTSPTMGAGSPGMWFIYPNTGASGAGVPASTTIASFNYVTGCGVLSNATTANVASLTLSVPSLQRYFNIPSSLSVPMESHAVMAGVQLGNNNQALFGMTTLGVAASAAPANQPFFAWSASAQNGTVSTARLIQGATAGNQSTSVGSIYPLNSAQVAGYSVGGTGGRTAYWMGSGQLGTVTLPGVSTATSLTGGSLGCNAQYQRSQLHICRDYKRRIYLRLDRLRSGADPRANADLRAIGRPDAGLVSTGGSRSRLRWIQHHGWQWHHGSGNDLQCCRELATGRHPADARLDSRYRRPPDIQHLRVPALHRFARQPRHEPAGLVSRNGKWLPAGRHDHGCVDVGRKRHDQHDDQPLHSRRLYPVHHCTGGIYLRHAERVSASRRTGRLDCVQHVADGG